ncbi:MAG: hypothetical protein PHV60_02740 [bacterium]|nr:hypothetical protein [bacterium]
MKKLLAVIIVGIFVLGSGLAVAKEAPVDNPGVPDQKMGQQREDWQAKRLERLSKELNLTAEQKEKVAGIFKESDAKIKAVMEKAKEDLNTIRDTGGKQIMAILTPEQARKFDEMNAERQKKMSGERSKDMMKMEERPRHEK